MNTESPNSVNPSVWNTPEKVFDYYTTNFDPYDADVMCDGCKSVFEWTDKEADSGDDIPICSVVCYNSYYDVENGCEEEEEPINCEICGTASKEGGVEFDYDDDCGFHCCQDEKCLRQFWKKDDEEVYIKELEKNTWCDDHEQVLYKNGLKCSGCLEEEEVE